MPKFFGEIMLDLEKRPTDYFRWHVGGDILNQDYLEHMKMVARSFPDTRFMAYTKQLELEFKDIPENLSILASMWPGWRPPMSPTTMALRRSWMQDGTEDRIPSNHKVCPGSCKDCKLCWNSDLDIVFMKH